MIAPNVLEQLVTAARQARRKAYAPYSRYAVGAAVLAASGAVYTGCNVENASFGLTVCAERVAVWNAITAGERSIVAVAVATGNGVAPCGACRQVLQEFAPAEGAQEADVLIVLDSGRRQRTLRLSELLPEAFRPQHLNGEDEG